MRNKRLPASIINPMARSTEEILIMEVGYDFSDVIEEWGGFSYGISSAGADFFSAPIFEMWLRTLNDMMMMLFYISILVSLLRTPTKICVWIVKIYLND